MKHALAIIVISALSGLPAMAGPVSFAQGWAEQRLQLFSSNEYTFGERLGITSDNAVSLAWARVPQAEWNAEGASWDWAVTQSVPATDLAQKGGDDRNISLYFVFVPAEEAPRLEGANIRDLLGNENVRVLQYVWGGDAARGAVIPSPYGPPGQGAMVVLRPAGTGAHAEQIDLAADYSRAFGDTRGALVGLAVSADSDDTDSAIRAEISGLVLR
jgi:hypothetical protein